MTANVSGGEDSRVGADYFVQLLAFDKSGDCFTTAALGSWTTRSRDQAVDRLRLYIRRARPCMSVRTRRSAARWAGSRRAARELRDTLAGGAMYVHVIGDGSTFYEISARPVVFPRGDEDRIGTWAPDETVPALSLSGRWSW